MANTETEWNIVKNKYATYKITSPNELELVLNQKVRTALESTYNILLDRLLKIIEEDVYKSSNATFYKESGSLIKEENWEIVKFFKRNGLNLILEFTGKYFPYDEELYWHSNPNGNEIDPQSFLHIIDEGYPKSGEEPPLGFPRYEGSEFWMDFLQYCADHLDEIFTEEYNKL